MTKKKKSSLDTIKCPECGYKIPITEALQSQITERLTEEYEKKLEQELEDAKSRFEEETRKEIEKEIKDVLDDAQSQLEEKSEEIKKLKKTELDLRKRERELEDRNQDIELEIQRGIDKEIKKAEKRMMDTFNEKHQMKDKEKDKQISDLKKKIDELQRSAEQGSSQLKGEVQELEIEDYLRETYPLDLIEPVPKGVTGADCIQRVYSNSGLSCGAIIWESKRTKNWNKNWIEKLKDDMTAVKGSIAVIVSETLPDEVWNFDIADGVWVCDYRSFPGLATVLREHLIQIESMKTSFEGKDEKMEVLFKYLIGPQFRQRVEAIIDSFTTMQDDLNKEKMAAKRRWSKREKQIEKIITNTCCMYGDLQGLIGTSMETIKALEEGDPGEFEEDDEE